MTLLRLLGSQGTHCNSLNVFHTGHSVPSVTTVSPPSTKNLVSLHKIFSLREATADSHHGLTKAPVGRSLRYCAEHRPRTPSMYAECRTGLEVGHLDLGLGTGTGITRASCHALDRLISKSFLSWACSGRALSIATGSITRVLPCVRSGCWR